MIYEDKGFLLNKNKYNENSVIAEFYTENNGKVSGIIFGATSNKIKSYLLIGNQFNIQFNSKNQNKAGYFKIEIEKIFTPFFFENKIKLNCILYSMNLIRILTVENQTNKNIYNQLFELFNFLKDEDDWLKKFIFWELKIIKLVGYDINFNDYVDIGNLSKKNGYVPTLDGTKQIPIFLLNSENIKINYDELKVGLKIVGDFLNKTVLSPNNINFPLSRNEFTKLI
tara:strand:- start:2080 stop:2757 length:678 start_codon:yes stop_codon:yes gene_type:complete